jgi:Flp pilus assembly protein TadG
MGGRAKVAGGPEAGSMVLEYGLILPVLLLLVFGTIEVGRLIWTYTTLVRATEASARCAAINPTACGTVAQIAGRAATEAWGLALEPSIFTSQTQPCGVQVRAIYTHSLLIPWPGGSAPQGAANGITLTVTACYPL